LSDVNRAYEPWEIVTRRVKEARRSAGWTQADLAARLEELGHGQIGQAAVARLENGKRAVRIDELFALGVALGVSPVHLLTPLEDEAEVKLTRSLTVPAPLARAWLRGLMALPGGKIRLAEMPESEQRRVVQQLAYREMTRGTRDPSVSPLVRSLTDASLKEEAERIADEVVAEIRKPKEENDG
jgi:transcriptional regulator with XRE-family HTH domain